MKIIRYNPRALNTLDVTAQVEQRAVDHAQALIACGADSSISDIGDIVDGTPFEIPVLILEEVDSGDNRIFEKKSITKKDGPLELLWQIATSKGHDNSVIVGRIDHIERLEDQPNDVHATTEEVADGKANTARYGWGRAYGVFDSQGVYGREAERLVRGGFLRGVSGDMDTFEASTDPVTSEDVDESNVIKNERITVSQARLIAATLVAKPAFQEAQIRIKEEPIVYADTPVVDGIYEDIIMEDTSALAASAAPVVPPKSWFNKPNLKGKTPITVTDDGQVFGHIAAWDVNHIALQRATKPPRSASNYAYFRTGVVRVDDGSDVAVGQLTLVGGHAPLTASHQEAARHYDDTASAVADVSAGEDEFGIWVAGALRPSVTGEQVRVLRASVPSGDWRPINGRLELVAVCQVNVPGFPVARSIVAGGQVLALVAAGARSMAEVRAQSVEERISALEAAEFSSKMSAAEPKFTALQGMQQVALAAAASRADVALEHLQTAALYEKTAKLQQSIDRLRK